MVRVITDLEVHEVSLVRDPANPEARVSLLKSKTQPTPKENDMTEIEKAAADLAKAQADLEKQKADIEKANADLAKANADLAAAQAAIEKQKAEAAEAVNKAAQIEKALAVEKAARLTREAGDRIEKSMKAVPVEKTAFAEKLVKLAELDAELAAFVEETLTKCSASIEASELLKKKSSNEPAEGSAVAKIAGIVKSKMAADTKLTKEAAEAQAWAENPGLYRQYSEEK